MTTRTRLDLFKRYRNEYVAPKQPRLIQVEPAQYLAIAAHGASDDSHHSETAAQEKALYAVATALRAVAVSTYQRDFVLGKLEWQLCSDNSAYTYTSKVMMRMPNFVTSDDVSHAVTSLLARGLDESMSQWVNHASLEQITEGLCVQMLHTGPNNIDAQIQTLAILQDFAKAHGFEMAGPPHVVYLASSQHVPPEHLRTLLRYPVRTKHVTECAAI